VEFRQRVEKSIVEMKNLPFEPWTVNQELLPAVHAFELASLSPFVSCVAFLLQSWEGFSSQRE